RYTGVELDILGPTPAFAAKVRGEYQWQFVIRSHELDALLDGIPTSPGWVVDIDPQSMMKFAESAAMPFLLLRLRSFVTDPALSDGRKPKSNRLQMTALVRLSAAGSLRST
ncbi:MAG: hypothetical protein M3173_07245, partial [Chloroflexota bacterium]|nr:hypothetical protein [Chloroflexota bacterium]